MRRALGVAVLLGAIAFLVLATVVAVSALTQTPGIDG